MPENSILFCIDTWKGSKVEQETNHATAKLDDGDNAYLWFCREMWDHIINGNVIPLRMTSQNAAKFFSERGIKLSFVFLDGGHSQGETKADIEAFLPLKKDGGTICGHDYKSGLWPDVTKEVLEVFGGNVGHPVDTTIWYTDSRSGDISDRNLKTESHNQPARVSACDTSELEQGSVGAPPPRIYDCFIFNNEREILHKRIMQLYNVVDRFVIVEANKTHSGNPKELMFEYCTEVIPYRDKITYIVADDLPEVEGTITDKSWARERHQRDAIMRGLTDCKDNDIVLISDVDEIPSVEAIQSFDGTSELRSFSMTLYYYNTDTHAVDSWREAKILPYGLLKQHSPCWVRYQQAEPIPGNGGQHLSYFGGIEAIQRKIENTAHQEYNTDFFKDPERIRKAIEEKRDLFDRDYVKFQ